VTPPSPRPCLEDEGEVRSTCCYCGTGCGVVIRTAGDRIVGVAGDADHPSSRGKLCSKGSTLHLTMAPAAMAGRARHPELRAARGAARARVSWDAALDFVAARFAATIEQHGPDAVAFYVSGQLLTEDYYVFNKLAKGLIGTANIDTNSRLCMSSAVSGYAATLGADAPPSCYEDIDHAGCLFIAGSNTAFAHPVLFRRIEEARERSPELKVIVVDPRRTQTARFADLHLAILPGTDVALFHAMLHVMLWEKLVDERYIEAHTGGFAALRALVHEYTPRAAAEICGVRADDIAIAARWFARSRATLSLYCQGLNQSSSGTAKNAALVNLHLATGHIGRPGSGPFSLTGQPNAMGGREVGGLATSLAAHRDLADPRHRAEMAKLWGVTSVASKPGLTAVELFAALKSGKVKNVWIACTNPAQSMPDLPNVRAALEAAELVVLQEAYANTETAPFADVLLPATSWGEKEGTVTNSERRIARVRAAVPKPFEARHDWEIVCDFARRLEKLVSETNFRAGSSACGNSSLTPVFPLFPFTTPESIWNEHREATRGRDLDITGLSYALLDERGPQQWPFPEGATQGKARLYEDGVFPTPDGKARFFAERHKPVAEAVDARYPLRLTTGRLRDHWHGLSRTGTLTPLFGHVPEPRLGMNAQDMGRRQISPGDLVRVQSRRGALHVIVEADADLRSGQVYLPMHWGKRFLGGRDSLGVNTITDPSFDPVSRQPELKHAAVKVSAADLPWRLAAFAECDAMAALERLQPLQADVVFASAVPMGRERPGILFRAAHEAAPCAAWLAALDAILGLDADEALRYEDARRGDSRRLLIRGDRLLAARLAGEASAIAGGEWLREWLVSARPVAEVRRVLLSAPARAPSGFVLAGAVVCQCFNVSEQAITAELRECPGAPRERLQALQAALKCGTNCGSCLPELRALVEKAAPDTGRMVA
jgi:assimilatory nitrate reductase catalytic subunit